MARNPFTSADNVADFLRIWLHEGLLSKEAESQLHDYYRKWRNLDSARLRYWYVQQLAEVEALIDGTDRPRVLEVGSGMGTEALWLAWRGSEVTGIELLDKVVAVAEERLRVLNTYRPENLTCRFENCSIADFQDDRGFDVIWIEQAFHHLEPRQQVVAKIADLLKRGGHVVFSEANALNPLLQAQLFRLRGFKTIVDVNLDGKRMPWGNERILDAYSLGRLMAKVGVTKKSVRYFRCFPSGQLFDYLFGLEKLLTALPASRMAAPIFTHYNFVGQRQA
jgi:SAM-dependent methyltransferase